MNKDIDPVKLELLRLAKALTSNQYTSSCVEDIIAQAQAMFDFICNHKAEKSIDETMSIYSDILKKLEKMNVGSE